MDGVDTLSVARPFWICCKTNRKNTHESLRTNILSSTCMASSIHLLYTTHLSNISHSLIYSCTALSCSMNQASSLMIMADTDERMMHSSCRSLSLYLVIILDRPRYGMRGAELPTTYNAVMQFSGKKFIFNYIIDCMVNLLRLV